MAYDRKKIFKEAISIIEENKLFFVEDVAAYLPINKKTVYEWWPIGSDESNMLKDKLDENKIEVKVSMRDKWHKSDNATLQLALMKLIGSDEERKKLSQSYVDVTTDSKPLNKIDLSQEQINKLIDKL